MGANRHDDATHNKRKSNDTDTWHVGLQFLESVTMSKEVIAEETDHHGTDGHIENVQEHAHCIHVDAGVCKPQDQQRRHDGSEQGADGRHSHGESHIAFCQVAHHIAGDAAGAAAHQNDTYSEIRIQSENFRKAQGNQRHDGVLSQGASTNIQRALRQVLEIFNAKGQAHGQHDDSENHGRYIAANPGERDRSKEGNHRAGDYKKRRIGGKKTGHRPDYFKHGPNIERFRLTC